MARLKENVRIRQGTPIAAISTSKARIGGEALSNAGKGLANFGSALAQAEKQDSDKMIAILKTRDEVEANTAVNKAIFEIRKKTIPGEESTIEDQFTKELAPLKEKFASYTGLRKENAINAFAKSFGGGESTLRGTFLTLRNADLNKQLGNTVKTLQDSVYNDSSQYTIALAKAFELTQSLSNDLTDESGLNSSAAFMDQLQDDFTQIALDGIIDSSDPDKFEKARSFIKNSLASFGPIQIDREMDKIDKLEIEEGSRELKLLTNSRKVDIEKKNIQREARFSKDVEEIINATTTEAKRQKLLDIRKAFVKGIYKKDEYEFFEEASVNPISDIESLDAELEIETMISRGVSTGITRRKLQLMLKNKDINGTPALKLMAKLRNTKARTKSKLNTKRIKQAEFIFRTQFAENPLDVDSVFSENKDKGIALAVKTEALRLETGGKGKAPMGPIKAMNTAIKSIVGVNALTQQIIIPFVKPIDQADSEARKGTQKEIVKKFTAIPKNKLTKKEKETFNTQMKAFKMNELLDELQQGLNFEPKKKGTK